MNTFLDSSCQAAGSGQDNSRKTGVRSRVGLDSAYVVFSCPPEVVGVEELQSSDCQPPSPRCSGEAPALDGVLGAVLARRASRPQTWAEVGG
jgi:hypothetical protein